MAGCGVYTGILFSRKACGQPAQVHCGRCKILLCKKHLVPQNSGPFLCPQCDRYENDRDWEYSERDRGWRCRTSRRDDERTPSNVPPAVAGGVAGGAASEALGEDDKDGLSIDTSQSGVPEDVDSDDDVTESDFDAS